MHAYHIYSSVYARIQGICGLITNDSLPGTTDKSTNEAQVVELWSLYTSLAVMIRRDPHLEKTHCYVAICDRRILWRCRTLWLKVSQFVTGVAICDGKCRNLWQRQNMQFNDIYSLNFDKYFVLSSYL